MDSSNYSSNTKVTNAHGCDGYPCVGGKGEHVALFLGEGEVMESPKGYINVVSST